MNGEIGAALGGVLDAPSPSAAADVGDAANATTVAVDATRTEYADGDAVRDALDAKRLGAGAVVFLEARACARRATS